MVTQETYNQFSFVKRIKDIQQIYLQMTEGQLDQYISIGSLWQIYSVQITVAPISREEFAVLLIDLLFLFPHDIDLTPARSEKEGGIMWREILYGWVILHRKVYG
jgi:hypothetical protein